MQSINLQKQIRFIYWELYLKLLTKQIIFEQLNLLKYHQVNSIKYLKQVIIYYRKFDLKDFTKKIILSNFKYSANYLQGLIIQIKFNEYYYLARYFEIYLKYLKLNLLNFFNLNSIIIMNLFKNPNFNYF